MRNFVKPGSKSLTFDHGIGALRVGDIVDNVLQGSKVGAVEGTSQGRLCQTLELERNAESVETSRDEIVDGAYAS